MRKLLLLATLFFSFMNIDPSITTLHNTDSAGSISIPSMNISANLYRGNELDYDTAQAICDEENAAIVYEGDEQIIADHSYQGFDRIKQSIPDETVAFIQSYDEKGNTEYESYVCTKVTTGKNRTFKPCLIDCEGNDLYKTNEGGICLYTCNDTWHDITIVYFKPAD